MELFWELAFTIAISLLLPFLFIKILFVLEDYDVNEKVIPPGGDHGAKSAPQNWETEEIVRIAGNFDEFRGQSILGKLVVPEIVDASLGSPKTRNAGNIDDDKVYNEIEIVDLAETRVEKTSLDSGLVCERAVDESDKGIKINEVEVEPIERESRAPEVKEVEEVEDLEISLCDINHNGVDESNWDGEVGESKSLLDDDDWEGIERTELDRRFGAAVAFVWSKSNANRVANLGANVKMQLYGYHKIATQGPCRKPQPMPLKFSARSKWNAWQRLGIMSPELAMERYINILTESIPDWMEDYHYENGKSASADIPTLAKPTL